MKPALSSLLDRARAARRQEDFATLLDTLAEAWRETRSANLATLIDGWVDALTPSQPPVGAASKSVQQAWLTHAQAQRTIDLGRLFEVLANATGPLSRDRILALAKWPPNPRIAHTVADWLLNPPFERKNRRICLAPAIDLLEQQADPRWIERLQSIVTPDARSRTIAGLGLHNWKRLQALAESSAAWRTAVTPVDDRLLDGLAPTTVAPPKSSVDLQALYGAVYAAPDDLQRRSMLADALQEAGDPRGEFIALQLGRAADARPSKRERELEAKWASSWLGALGEVLKAPRFDRGFVTHAKVAGNVTAVAGRPEWTTLERLELRGAVNAEPLLRSPHLARLREVVGLDWNVLAALIKRGQALPWTTLEIFAFEHAEGGGADYALLGGAGAVLPKVRRLSVANYGRASLHIGPAQLTSLVMGPVGRGLDHLSLALDPRDALRSVEIVRDSQLARFDFALSRGVDAELDLKTRALELTLGFFAATTYGPAAAGGVAAQLAAFPIKLARVVLRPGEYVRIEGHKLVFKYGEPASLAPILKVLEKAGAEVVVDEGKRRGSW